MGKHLKNAAVTDFAVINIGTFCPENSLYSYLLSCIAERGNGTNWWHFPQQGLSTPPKKRTIRQAPSQKCISIAVIICPITSRYWWLMGAEKWCHFKRSLRVSRTWWFSADLTSEVFISPVHLHLQRRDELCVAKPMSFASQFRSP